MSDGILRVHIPNPRSKDLQRLTDDEIDAYLAEHDVVQQELGSLDDRELDVLLEASAPSGSAGVPPGAAPEEAPGHHP